MCNPTRTIRAARSNEVTGNPLQTKAQLPILMNNFGPGRPFGSWMVEILVSWTLPISVILHQDLGADCAGTLRQGRDRRCGSPAADAKI